LFFFFPSHPVSLSSLQVSSKDGSRTHLFVSICHFSNRTNYYRVAQVPSHFIIYRPFL
jgi:hypothetical protein